MRVVRLTSSLTLALVSVPAVSASQALTIRTSEVERVAVAAAIERAGLRDVSARRVVIDPVTVRANEAPGFREMGLRDSTRQESLLRAFGAASHRRLDVIRCVNPPCLPDIDVIVTISEPVMYEDSASVTVTTLRHRPHARSPRPRTQYITTGFVLRRESGRWTIVRMIDLGVS
jgi:hypothetical protein